nr:hypothetical protein [uncultured Bacteroides sp.]
MRLKTILSGLLCVTTLFSCTDETDKLLNEQSQSQAISNELLDTSVAQKNFAQILSKAVYENETLRQFIKKEAIKQFDNDYDVFYPFVKDQKVEGEKTFRDILLKYTTEKELGSIEMSLPLLNIMIPDFSFIGAFCADKWDTSDNEVAVSYAVGNKHATMYAEGDSVANLEKGELPDFPFLVIKNNERMKVTVNTRSLNTSNYDFADEAFNGTLNPHNIQTRATDWELYPTQESTEPYINKDDVDKSVIEAYNEFKINKKGVDRDYIYYGLSNDKSTNGSLDTDMTEVLYKFKISSNAYSSISDPEDGDPQLNIVNGEYGEIVSKINELSQDYILNNIWTAGNFEFRFYIYVGKRDATSIAYKRTVTVSPQQLFQVDRIHVHKRHKTGFRHTKYTYSVSKNSLKPRWVDTKEVTDSNIPITIEPWDLANQALNIHIVIEEFDNSHTVEKEYSFKTEYSNKIDFSAGINSGGVATKVIGYSLKLGYGFSTTTTRYEAMKITTQKSSNDLGSITLNFYDPIITSDQESNSKGYKVYTYNSGSVELMILPHSKRNLN